MSWRPVLFASIFLVALFAPMNSTLVGYAQAEDTTVCCDSVGVSLHLMGSDSSGSLTPFIQDLTETTMTKTIATAVASEETVGTWSLPEVWPGTVPASTWEVEIAYEVTNAAGAQVNATASLQIGSQTYTAQTGPTDSFLGQGEGTLQFEIDVDATSISSSSNVVLTVTARSVVFNLPTGEAQLQFQWGSEDRDSVIKGDMPLMSLTLLQPEVEGSEVYFSVVIDSSWGTKILSNSESLNMRVNGIILEGDPIETSQGDGVRITWTWLDASGGEESVEAKVELILQEGDSMLSGTTTFIVETFDSNGGTGTYYPPDEPLQTDGDGSKLSVSGVFALGSGSSGLQLTRETTITMDDEMAFWMRWGLDHIGDDVTDLSPAWQAFDEGSVTDDDRTSRSIEANEVNEFENQMQSKSGSASGLYSYFMSQGVKLDSDELLGEYRAFDSIEVKLDLHGEVDVVNHPVSLVFKTVEVVDSKKQMELFRNFVVVQTTPIWSQVDISLEGTSSGFSAFMSPTALQSEDVDVSHSRFPWGETLTINAEGLDQNEKFTIVFVPTADPLSAPMPLTIGVGIALFVGLFVALRLSKNKSRSLLALELLLVPLIAFIHFFAFTSLFVGGAVVFTILLWFITAVSSPRIRLPEGSVALAPSQTIPCPACSTPNPVLSNERPFRFACAGCARVIKLVA